MKKAPGSSEEHERIVAQTLILLGREAHQLCRVFRNETGVAYRDELGGRKWIAYGVKGSPDIYGILLGGSYLGMEVKSGNAVQAPHQIRFMEMVRKFGGFYFVVRSPEEALEFVFRAAAK